jgi:nitric oxide reductase activation protein|tara:strand:- start:685 stop:1062 length:378 start_codon:yes stop_codon:yes gene_type:complete
MAFLKRLGWYLVGLSIGLIFLVFILKKKSGEEGIDFCYFPNCRVLKDMRSKPLTFSESLPEQYQDTLMIQAFLQDGDVDFGKSDTKSEPCKTYFISHEYNGEAMELQAKNCEDSVEVENLQKNNE